MLCAGFHFDGPRGLEPLRPREGGGRDVDILFVAIGDLRDFQKDAAGDTAFKIGPIDGDEGAGEADAAFSLTQVGGAEGG